MVLILLGRTKIWGENWRSHKYKKLYGWFTVVYRRKAI